MVLDQSLVLQVAEGAGQGTGVDDFGTSLGYGVVEPGVPKWTVLKCSQDGPIELSFRQVIDGFEVIRQRNSPPPVTSALLCGGRVYEAAPTLTSPFIGCRALLSDME